MYVRASTTQRKKTEQCTQCALLQSYCPSVSVHITSQAKHIELCQAWNVFHNICTYIYGAMKAGSQLWKVFIHLAHLYQDSAQLDISLESVGPSS